MNEKVLYDAPLRYRDALWHQPFWSLLLLVGFLKALWDSFSLHIKVTDQRVLLTQGVFSRQDIEVEYARVREVSYRQSLLERFANIGIVTLISSDPSTPILHIPLPDPQEMKEQIRSMVRSEKINRGIRMEENF